jgi:O-antigen ligase
VKPSAVNFTFILVWLFVFEAFVRLEDIFPITGALHPVLSLGIGAAIAQIHDVITGRARFLWSRELNAVLLLTGWFILGIPFAIWHGGSMRLLVDVWLRTLLFFFLLTQTLTTFGRVRKILWAVLLSELVASVASLLVRGNATYSVGGRFAGINKGLLGWNFLGITLSVTLPFLAWLYVTKRSALRTTILLAALGSSVWMVMLTASRGGLMGIILSLALTWWFVLRGTRRGRPLAALLILGLLVSVGLAPSVLWDRAATVWSSSPDQRNAEAASAEDSTEGRIRLLEASIADTLQHPIFGLGLGNFSVYQGNQGHSTGWYGTHNTFTQVSSEAGIPALLLLIYLIWVAIQNMKKVSHAPPSEKVSFEIRQLANATRASILIFVFTAFFAHIAYEYLLYSLIGIAVGVWTVALHAARTPARDVSPAQHVLGAFDNPDLQWHSS